MIDLVPNPDASVLEAMARDLRPGDRLELQRLGLAPTEDDVLEALVKSCEASLTSVLVSYKGRPAALYGLQLVLPLGWGVPWLLTTHVVEEAPVRYTRICRRIVDRMFGYAHTLIQWVDEEYVQAWRWLEGPLGFHRYASQDFLAGGRWPFRAYRKLAPSPRRAR